MQQNNVLIILCVTLLTVVVGVVGYILGKLNCINVPKNNRSFFDKNENNKTRLSDLTIDDKKIVVDIKTDGLEKKYDSLGEIKQTEENISNSINKLKNLKR